MKNWTLVTPTTPGLYWFFGDIYGDLSRAKYSLAEARQVSNGVLITMDGVLVGNEAVGFWAVCTPPDLPPIIERAIKKAQQKQKQKGK